MTAVDDDVARRALRLLAGPGNGSAEPLARLRAEVAGDARARESVELALTVSERLAERDRRERELTALYETAGDLSSLRDVQEVLQAIVARARGLLGTEAAYLMLIDEQRGDTYVRVTDGIHTDAFKAARLAMGAGLGGLVAQTRQPYATPDYPHDRRFRHTVDEVVVGEGLIAVLGVPLLLRERVIGVLFAANRRERPFADAEVALLISLATHAAIAIETASLFADVRAHSDLMERAANVHERLTTVAAQGGQLPEVAAVVAEVLGAGVFVADPALRVLASAGPVTPAPGGPVTGDLAKACRSAIATRATAATPAGCAAPVVAGSQVLAVLVACRGLDVADQRTVERAALVAAILLLTERQLTEAEHRVRGDLLTDLLAEAQPEPDGLRRRARLLGWDLDRPHALIVAHPERAEDRRIVASALGSWAAQCGGLCGEHGRTVVVLLPGTDPAQAGPAAVERLGRAVAAPVTVGAAGPGAGPAGLRDAHRDARHCVDVLCALGKTGVAASPADLGAFGLLFGPAGRERVAAFVQRTLGAVVDYDAQRGSELLRTVEAYFDADGSHVRAAAALFIHVNTLYQRIERITALLGEGWRTGEKALQIRLAVKLHRIVSFTDQHSA
ncbi:helix-turn-helix domain-containing protein [Micromonospora sp. NBC_00898]|uniref:helix-turn-helix domain-containing protein n=1 Tax=Micromonospora sp. NBC_00898 TaxID=2975981 RepID=UPI00386FC0D5|nr:helix-turn-helix domain-containing protein [Micromonospora sp. NBC_00898]